MPPDPPSLACLYMHTYTPDTYVTPLLKILATGLVQLPRPPPIYGVFVAALSQQTIGFDHCHINRHLTNN